MSKPNQFQVSAHGDCEILITRLFAAPRELVFDAMTLPELVTRWLSGPPGWTTTGYESDLRPGSSFRHSWRGPDGMEMSMRGVYREVVRPERIVRTESFEFGCEPQGGEQVGTLVLTEQDGQTLLTLTLVYPNREARDATLASGMERGVSAGYDRLDELLAQSA